MTRLLFTALLAATALLSCSTASKVDPLEAKARDGDPVAACQLAARSLYDCALEQKSWEVSKIGPRPACVNQGISDQQTAYLDKAADKLSAIDRVLFAGPRIELLLAYVTLVIGPTDKAIEQAAAAQQSCSKFADGMVD